MNKNTDILDNILGYPLDKEQRQVVYDNHKNTLVVAGAGSGKTLTIIGKIRYLIDSIGIKEKEILVISFTKETVNSIKNKLKDNYNYDMDIYTFHKLALNILNLRDDNIKVAPSDYLEYFIEEYFNTFILENTNEMQLVLKYFNKYITLDINKEYKKILKEKKKDIDNLKNIISKFIHLFKERGYKLDKFLEFLKINRNTLHIHKVKVRIFLTITLNIYYKYQCELISSGMVDFSDMLLNAIELLKSERIHLGYKYIIVDEYQDSSYLRFSLIKMIEDIDNAKLLAVGDDFQSIYKFTGCTLDMFLNFKNLFDDTCILKITNTYRNSQELIDIAYKFIIKNKKQIQKELRSSKHQTEPIRIITTNNQRKSIKQILDKLNNTDILILGRNNFDIKYILDNELIKENDDIKYTKNSTLKIRYLTVHRSKGLEASIVIVINVNDTMYGFPSKVKENKFLHFVLDSKEYYKYEEERRLFYVALTRTKNITYILTDKSKKSIFVKEIEKIIKSR